MKKHICTCSAHIDEQKCIIHKKSRYRNIWKQEGDFSPLIDEEKDQ